MLVGGVVDDQLGDDAQAPAVRLADELTEVGPRPVRRRDVVIIGDVVPVVFHRRRIERQQPHRVDAQIANVVELFGEPCDVADAVVVGVEKRLYVKLVDDRILVPERIVGIGGRDDGCGVLGG